MKLFIRWSSNAAAILGVLCCALAASARLVGIFYLVGGVEAITVFVLGTGLMVYACLCKLELLLQRHNA